MNSEFQVMLRGARSRVDAEQAKRLAELLGAPVDWAHLIALCRRNRVLPLLYHSLRTACQKAVPPDVLTAMRDYYQSNSTHSYLMTEELKKILTLLRENGITCIPLKGPLLTENIYGSPALREYSDLDLLIKKSDVRKARETLRPCGYRPAYEHNEAAEALHFEAEIEYDLMRDRDKMCVEMHWELTHGVISGRFDTEGVWDRLVQSSVSGCETRTLSREDCLIYLCMHGSQHFWPKLLWICDVNEFLRAAQGLDWSWMVKETKKMGSLRMFLLGLHLARALLDATLPGEIEALIGADPEIEKCTHEIVEGLASLTYREPGFVETKRLNLRLRERLRDRVGFFLHFALKPNSRDALALPLPRPLHFLYYVLHPLRQIGEYVPLALGGGKGGRK